MKKFLARPYVNRGDGVWRPDGEPVVLHTRAKTKRGLLRAAVRLLGDVQAVHVYQDNGSAGDVAFFNRLGKSGRAAG